MEYKQTKAYMLHKLNTAFESFTNLSSHHVDNHKAMIEFFESNSDKIKDVSLEYWTSECVDISDSLVYVFTIKSKMPHDIYIEFFQKDNAFLNEYLLESTIKEIEFEKLQDLKDFLKTEIFN